MFPRTHSALVVLVAVLGGFDGSTYGPEGALPNEPIFCGVDGISCPADVQPLNDDGTVLYPIDNAFGFKVYDFLGAVAKTRDFDYQEGFAGNIVEAGNVVGLKVSNVATDTYKVKPPLGTWCQGLGGTSVKCDTEHYTVMEHALTCHETVPYFFANPLDITDQAELVLERPDGTVQTLDCGTDALLDDTLFIIENGQTTGKIYDGLINDMEPNDNIDVQNNIATSRDYSITKKDDGKVLYRWGSLIKRPTDVRIYAKLSLPDAWKDRDSSGNLVNDFTVTKARLVVEHLITNNPNDQLRAEDLENEGATGRKPDYRVVTEGNDEYWKSIADCVEGDGDLIEGDVEATPLPEGTVLKNGRYTYPDAFSSDLVGGFTNAFYTTLNRDPFEWSYLRDSPSDPNLFEFVGSATPLTEAEASSQGLSLVSGPRWRLKAGKFGQDLPSIEIPIVECSPPPVQRDNIKYPTGQPTVTYINLLDWNEAEGPSPLATSKGWVDVNENSFVSVNPDFPDGVYPVTTNGLPMTEDFDLAVYIKGDKKPTAIYRAWLEIDYDTAPPTPTVEPTPSPMVQVPTPTPSPMVSTPTLSPVICSAEDFFGECSATLQCKAIYGDDANDCDRSGGKFCVCGDGDVCGCVIDPPTAGPTLAPVAGPTAAPAPVDPSPTSSPTDSCNVEALEDECNTTNGCKQIYPTAYDCKKSEGGICYCGDGDPGTICGCL